MREKTKACFLPVTMKLFWQLYPQLEERFVSAERAVRDKLSERFELCECEAVGSEEEALSLAETLKNREISSFIVWEMGYVASGIPAAIIEKFPNVPIALFVTQRDRVIPADMDYARYMESTATTSATEFGGMLARKGIPYKAFIGHMDDGELYGRLGDFMRAADVAAEMKKLKVGRLGWAYPGMLDICVDDAAVAELGASVDQIPLSEVAERLTRADENETEAFIGQVKTECDYSKVPDEDLHRSAKLYTALDGMVEEHGLGALCVHDYDCLSQVTKTVSDFALSYLENRRGLATGVEGDMPNTLSAYIARAFSGGSPMFVDWTMYDEERNALFLQHNGKADPAIVAKPVLSPSAEPFGGVEGGAVVFEASGKPGPVTLVSMIYTGRGWKLFAAEGEAIENEPRPCRLNQMTVKVDKPAQEFLETVCGYGMGHHVNAAYGHFAGRLKYLCEILGIEYLTIK